LIEQEKSNNFASLKKYEELLLEEQTKLSDTTRDLSEKEHDIKFYKDKTIF